MTKRSIVQLPKDKARCLEKACYGNSRIGGLLDYFIYGANFEVERLGLEEGCNVVTLTRKHKDILEKLNFNISRKTLIHYLDLLSEWGYVTSHAYGRDFTVHGDKIQEVVDNPPKKPERAAYNRRSQKGCKVDDLQPSEVVDFEKVELEQKVVTLQQKVVESNKKVEQLQLKVVTLQQKVDLLSTLQPRLEALLEQVEVHNLEPYSNYCNELVITEENSNISLATENEVTLPSVTAVTDEEQIDEPKEQDSENEEKMVHITEARRLRKTSKKKERHAKDLVPQSPPIMPPDDMAWGTKKCLLIFDAWRGKTLIGYYKLSQASSCAKELANQYTEEEVRKVYKQMNEDEYWIERGGADICNVSNNIHREIKRVKTPKVTGKQSVHGTASHDSYTKDERIALLKMSQEERKMYNQKRREEREKSQEVC